MHKFVSRSIIKELEKEDSKLLKEIGVDKRDRKYQVWQRNSLPIKLYDTAICEQKLTYIHNNPLQEHWQLVEKPEEYFYSSASFYLQENSTFNFITHYLD